MGPMYAGFWRRFLAAFIDGLVLLIPNRILMAIFGEGGLDFFLSVMMDWLYFALMESSERQATLGKMALGIIVTDMEGRPISLGRATGRYFGKCISALLLCVGYIMIAFTERQQALHDMMAGTLVVRRD